MIHKNTCKVCGKMNEIQLDDSKYNRWKSGEYAQSVWPEKTADERELIISGTRSGCWDKLFGKEDED